MLDILVIEDDEQVRSILRTTLEHAGYDVAEAPDGEMGIRSLSRTPAALVITDIVMPNKEGLETIQDLRRDFPNVKIIAISGGGPFDTQQLPRTAFLLGVHRTFAKPLDWHGLLEAVRELVGEQS